MNGQGRIRFIGDRQTILEPLIAQSNSSCLNGKCSCGVEINEYTNRLSSDYRWCMNIHHRGLAGEASKLIGDNAHITTSFSGTHIIENEHIGAD